MLELDLETAIKGYCGLFLKLLHDLLSFVIRPYFPVETAIHSQTVSKQLTKCTIKHHNSKQTKQYLLQSGIYHSQVPIQRRIQLFSWRLARLVTLADRQQTTCCS